MKRSVIHEGKTFKVSGKIYTVIWHDHKTLKARPDGHAYFLYFKLADIVFADLHDNCLHCERDLSMAQDYLEFTKFVKRMSHRNFYQYLGKVCDEECSEQYENKNNK